MNGTSRSGVVFGQQAMTALHRCDVDAGYNVRWADLLPVKKRSMRAGCVLSAPTIRQTYVRRVVTDCLY